MNIIERFQLKGKKALVTGAAQGLGKSFAEALAQAGADVAVADINMAGAQKVADEIKATGRQTMAIRSDISKCADIQAMIHAVISEWGQLDVAVNNVGIALPIKAASEITEAEWDKIINVNLKGTFFCAQYEGRAMMPKHYGKIINIASICGYIVWPEYQSLYSLSKAAIIHMTRCLAVEWIRYGIRVNSISPGVTRTPELFPEVIPVFLKKAPIDHIAEVTDLQGAVLYLASEVSDFMVGQDLILDGGYTLI